MIKRTPIKRKKCNCSPTCDKWPTMGCNGKNYNCLSDEEKLKKGSKRKVAQRNKNARLAAVRKIRKFETEKDGGEKWRSDMWFTARRLEMTGHCIFCNGITCKDASNFKNSVCHLFEKAHFESIKWHPENWFEACFYGNSHHTNFDAKSFTFEIIKKDYRNAWTEIVRKTKILYPLMTSHEQGRVPEILLENLK